MFFAALWSDSFVKLGCRLGCRLWVCPGPLRQRIFAKARNWRPEKKADLTEHNQARSTSALLVIAALVGVLSLSLFSRSCIFRG